MAVRSQVISGACLWVLIAVAGAASSDTGDQSDPVSLQQRAVAQIVAFRDRFRLTGDFSSRRGELEQAGSELRVSNEAFAARGDSPEHALGLSKQGSALRMLGRSSESVPLYQRVVDVAERCGLPAAQAAALTWKALAAQQDNDHGAALADVRHPLQLPLQPDDQNRLADALDLLAPVQIKQQDLNAAAAMVSRPIEGETLSDALPEPYDGKLRELALEAREVTRHSSVSLR